MPTNSYDMVFRTVNLSRMWLEQTTFGKNGDFLLGAVKSKTASSGNLTPDQVCWSRSYDPRKEEDRQAFRSLERTWTSGENSELHIGHLSPTRIWAQEHNGVVFVFAAQVSLPKLAAYCYAIANTCHVLDLNK